MKIKSISRDFYGVQFAILNRVFKVPGLRSLWFSTINRDYVIDPDMRPVFIVGCGHSGTSVLTAILDGHSRLGALAGESFAFRPWFSAGKIKRYLAAKIVRELPGDLRLLEKTPRHVHEVRRIKRLFPNAQVIAITRDGRDVVASIKKRTGRIRPAMQRFRNDNLAVIDLRSESWVHIISYENLVRNSDVTIKAVLEFLGEPYEPVHDTFTQQERRWYGDGSEHGQRRAAQVRQPIFDGTGKWREILSEDELKRFNEECGDVQKRLGYA